MLLTVAACALHTGMHTALVGAAFSSMQTSRSTAQHSTPKLTTAQHIFMTIQMVGTTCAANGASVTDTTSHSGSYKLIEHACMSKSSDALVATDVQVPKPPKKDFYKLMNKDKIVLRFSTRFVETPTHQLSSSDRSASLS